MENVSETTKLLPSKRTVSYSSAGSLPDMNFDIDNIDNITLTWQDINVFVPAAKGKCCRKPPPHLQKPKQILNNVSGIVRPGELLAIMGASGSGKTTLLNVLTYRNRGNLVVDGDVRINGKKIGRAITSLSAYVQQDDLFVGTLKVREHLVFQALLRMDKQISYQDRMARIDEVILELGLTKCKNTIIGVPNKAKGISGGERKRLAFASEVLTNPPLMFCDEPTSGLDSFMAESVITVLKDMACKGKTVVCTIHQPSSEIYSLFTQLLLMAEGRVAFIGSTRRANTFFSELGYVCPPNFNPSDYFVHTLAIIPGKEEECRQRVEKVANHFQESAYAEKMKERLNNLADREDLTHIEEAFAGRSPYKASWCSQLWALLWRSCIVIIREPLVLKVRLFQSVLISVILGLIYLQQTINAEGVMNINGALFLLLTNMTFSNLFGVINVFTAELPVFLRDHQNGMYRVDTYFIAKTMADIPCYIIIPFVFVTISYWMIGFYASLTAYLITCGVVILISNCAVSFGYMISCICRSTTLALSLSAPLIIPLLLFGGFFLNNASVPVYFIWLQYLSWFKYGNEALSINQWQYVDKIDCGNYTFGCPRNGTDVLRALHFHDSNIILDIILLFVLLIGFRLAAFFALLIRSYRSK